jgi:predicted nucleotidyltransferase
MHTPPDLNLTSIQMTVKNILSQYSEFAFLLGSAATERFNEKSDIDLAVFWKPNIDEKIKTQCWNELEDIFGRETQVVGLNKVDIIFARQVLETGRILFVNSDGELLNWKMIVLSMYPDFKYSRNIVEKNILNRKKNV